MRSFSRELGFFPAISRAFRHGAPAGLLMALLASEVVCADLLPHGRSGMVVWSYGFNGVARVDLPGVYWSLFDTITIRSIATEFSNFRGFWPDGDPVAGPMRRSIAGDLDGLPILEYRLDLWRIPVGSTVSLAFNFPTVNTELYELKDGFSWNWLLDDYNEDFSQDFVTIRPVPEPGNAMAVGTLLGLACMARRR